MFQRILHEDWTYVIPFISFGLTFAVFVVATVRALRIRPGDRKRLAALPLDETNPR